MARVLIVAGQGPGFGSGHMTRMHALCGLLQRRGISTELVPFALDPKERPLLLPSADLLVLDARDLEPDVMPGNARILALDNQCVSRGSRASLGQAAPAETVARKTVFFDSIPHPRLVMSEVLPNVLLGPDLLATIRATRRRTLLIYAPTGQRAQTVRTALTRAGWDGPIVSLSQERWVPRHEFLSHLSQARLCVTHFGMTMLEAWYLQIPVALASTDSAVHETLGLFAERAVGFPFLDDAALGRPGVVSSRLGRARRFRPVVRPGSQGFSRLIARIEEHLP